VSAKTVRSRKGTQRILRDGKVFEEDEKAVEKLPHVLDDVTVKDFSN
jgi:hypothetical protein